MNHGNGCPAAAGTPALVERIEEAEEEEKQDSAREDVEDALERGRLRRYVGCIEECAPGSYLALVEPEGSEGRSFDQELDAYRERGDGSCAVHFSYPHAEEGETDAELEEKLHSLSFIREQVQGEEAGALRLVVEGMVDVAEAKLRHLLTLRAYARLEDDSSPLAQAKRQALEDECSAWAEQVFGPLRSELVERARVAREDKRSELERAERPSALAEALLASRFDASDTVYEFNHFFERAGLGHCLAVVDQEKKNCATIIHSKEFAGRSVVKIPARYDINGLKLMQLLGHESQHIITGEFQYRQLGLGRTKFGPNADAVKEGLAVLREMEIANEVFGEERLRHKAHPYYILAMEEVRERSHDGQEPVDVGKLYEFIRDMISPDFSRRGFREQEIDQEARKILRRIFRGVPGERHFNTKDSIYFRGEEMARQLRDAGKDVYIEECFVDPDLIPLFIKLGVYAVPEDKQRLVPGYEAALKDIIKQEEWQKVFLENRLLWQLFASWEK